jgi:methylphosphotriester-DNA--protein-cysteine methyltransferase
VEVRVFEPGPALAPFVRSYEIVEAAGAVERTLVPESGITLGFRYAGASWLVEGRTARKTPDAAVTGLRLSARRMRTADGSGVLVAKLRAGSAPAFLEGSLHRLFGETRPLSVVAPRLEVERGLHDVRAAATDAERVAALERFLLRCAARRRVRPDPCVDEAVRAILADPGGVRVGPLAAALGLSVDGLERRFRRRVGASPKQLASIVRLREAVIGAAARPPLGALAAAVGYYDQAHLNRQFVAMLGAAPGAFLSRVEYCLDEPPAAAPERPRQAKRA